LGFKKLSDLVWNELYITLGKTMTPKLFHPDKVWAKLKRSVVATLAVAFLFTGSLFYGGSALAVTYPSYGATKAATTDADKPNIVVIWGADIGQSDISAYTKGLMGFRTPNIDRVASEGMIFTDYYAEQSCTAGRSAFITGQSVFRTGLAKWDCLGLI
jgi:hypothetical protein